MTSALNTFSPSDLAVSTQNLNTELLLLTLDANTLSLQPDITVSEVPGLPLHQRSARQTAHYFITDVSPAITAVNSSIIGFANQFVALSPQLLALAQIIDDATMPAGRRQECAAEFAKGLTTLSSFISCGQPQRDTTVSVLNSLGLRLKQNTTALDGDMAMAEKNLGEGTVKQLEAQLTTVQDAMDRDNSTLANGAVKGLVSGLKISVGIVTAYTEPGDGLELIVSGIEGSMAVGQEQQAAMADLQKQFSAYQKLLTSLSGAQVAYAGVQNVSRAADGMATRQNTASAAMDGVTVSWNDLSRRLQGLANTLSTTVPSNLMLTAQLDTAVSAWRNLKDEVVRWQADGAAVAPVQQVSLG